jgi:hypothetical protein
LIGVREVEAVGHEQIVAASSSPFASTGSRAVGAGAAQRL